MSAKVKRIPPGDVRRVQRDRKGAAAESTRCRLAGEPALMAAHPPDPEPISTVTHPARIVEPVKNRKLDSVGRSPRSARRTIAQSTVPPRPAVSAAVGDIEMVRERTRGRIALAVISLLALVVLSGVIGLASGKLSVNEVKELVASQTALLTLVGTAMGFYFGRTTR